jgi:signal transduction histidine kinase
VSIRWRLTLVYAAVAVASASVLLTGIYVLVSLRPTSKVFVGSGPLSDDLPAPSDGNVVTFQRAILGARDDAVQTTLHSLLVWSAAGLLAMAVVSVVVGWAVAGRALAPVHTITSRARRISAHSLDDRLALDGPRDELREMAETFDELLDRIQQTVESERRLVATMSHELRTPLANQRTALDVALADPDADAAELRRAGNVALGQALRAQRTVEALLTLARVQSGADTLPMDAVAWADQVADVVATVRSDHPEAADLDWEVEVEPVTVMGHEELLSRAVDNLVANAVVHNLPGGWVRVTLTHAPGGAVLQVSNSGPPLSPETVGALTLPFRRGSADRTASSQGTGLGLTIVQAVVDHHGGGLELAARPEGGLVATLTLTAR